MKFKTLFCNGLFFVNRHIFLILWISLVSYLFYDTFICYKYEQEFYYLRRILGLGLCISRGTATVLNVCAALILLPLCKKLNLILYKILSKIWPKLFFFWLEKAKSIHMTIAITLAVFAVLHSISHFVNLWNFSRGYDEERPEINFANYKDENPFALLFSMAGLTGVSMLIIILCMSVTSMRFIRRKVYNTFWYTHQLYMLFIVLLIVHPLSGVLKKQVLDDDSSLYHSHFENMSDMSVYQPKFVPIESRAWLWMLLPLTCYFMDLSWRICTRNRARVQILNATLMPGGCISLNLSCPHDGFVCRAGQYVLLQCLDVSVIEWHPFTIVKVPTLYQRNFTIWIRVKGDWTESLQDLLQMRARNKVSLLVDGPFSSPMEGVRRNDIAICIAAGVGITPFVSLLHDMLINPRSRSPGRVHLLWIVRHEKELIWIAELANKTIRELRNANRPDRLHLELYVTGNKNNLGKELTDTIILNNKGEYSHVLNEDNNRKATRANPIISRYNSQIRSPVNDSKLKVIHTTNLYRNSCLIQKSNDSSEMAPLLTPNLKPKFPTKDDNKGGKVNDLTPYLNRNESRIIYVGETVEIDTLLTPNLKRNKSKGENHKEVSFNYSHKAVTPLNLTSTVQDKENIRLNRNNTDEILFHPLSIKRNEPKIDSKGVLTINKDNSLISFELNDNADNLKVNSITKTAVCELSNNNVKINNFERNLDNKDGDVNLQITKDYDILKEHPLLACRVRNGRPHWDHVFGYWVHLYPRDRLNLYCCGPKKLVKSLKKKCKEYSRDTKTVFTFVHEGFS